MNVHVPNPPGEASKSGSRTRQWLSIALIVLTAVAGFVAAAGIYADRVIRGQLVATVEEHYRSKVEVKDFNVRVFPSVHIAGKGLVLRHRGRNDVPPFIAIDKFSVDTELLDLLRARKRLRKLTLEGLHINVPPRTANTRDSGEYNVDEPRYRRKVPNFVIDRVAADQTTLTILPRIAQTQPLVFNIDRLKLRAAGNYTAMTYEAVLRNAKPPGSIATRGDFGPWHADDPSLTRVSGHYVFRDADLSVFRGIAGTLSSVGNFKGVLERIEVSGDADTPDFALRTSSKPVHLKTHFRATVDGTDGNTRLHEVRAQFLNSTIQAHGGVEGTPGVKGKTVRLQAVAQRGRIEDFLVLAVKSTEPFITGATDFKARLELPPGNTDVVDRLRLNGDFGLQHTHFENSKVEHQITKLSRRAQGETKDSGPADVASNLNGRLSLSGGVLKFSQLSFAVPGATIQLHGTYEVDAELLDFRGTLRMRAPLPKTTTGVKSALLKIVEPLFKGRHGGSIVPIKITGTREHPSVALDVGRVLAQK